MKFDYTLYPGKKIDKIDFKKNDEKPIISIITPFYNAKKYIKETANSILNQTFPYWEWIIVDDGSKDKESLEELDNIQKLDSRIKVFHKENKGLAHTRDFGVKHSNSSSEYLVFLDDDDVINKTYLECAYWALETNTKASWAYTDTVNFGEQEFLWRKWFDCEEEKKENLLVAMAMVRKKAFEDVNGYEIREKAVFEDWNLWLKMLSKGMFPVRMNFFGFWYRKKQALESELARSKNNREHAMEIIAETAKNIKTNVEAIQYPKQDYNWDIIIDKVGSIKLPVRERNNKIKILMFVPWMVTGGADKFNLDLIRKIDKNKFEIILISTEPNNNPWRQEFEKYCTIYDLTSFLDRKYWVSFINYLIEVNQINIIFNTNSTFGYSILPYLKVKNPHIPIIDYIHMEEWYNRNGGFSRDSSAIASVIDKTLVCNNNSKNVLIEHFRRKEEDIETVYIGVDEKKYNPELYDKNKILKKYNIDKQERFIISFIARIAEQKRPHLLVKIIEELKNKRNDFCFLIAGDGNMLPEIKKQIRDKKLNSNVIFLGNVKDTEEIYAISDLTINCSIKEGVALTSYESLSMGVPVVSSDVGGQKELINNEVGVIVPCLQKEEEIFNFNYSNNEINQYVEGINKVLNNLSYYKENCRNRIINGFTIDNMVRNMTSIFERILMESNNKEDNQAKMYQIDITKELITKNFICFSEEYRYLCNTFNSQYLGVGIDKNREKATFKQRMWEHAWWRAIIKILQITGIMYLIKKIKLDRVIKKTVKKLIKE